MENRGASRPMAEENGGGHGKPYSSDRMEMLHKHYRNTLWIYWTLILLGIWLIISPLTFSYSQGIAQPSGGRDIWLTNVQRISFMKWSDLISGILLIFFAWRALKPDRPVSLWICCFIGVWLSMAPVIFWAPTAMIYMNNTLTGMLIIALTILIPGMPNMIRYMKMGSEVPPGWTYNPSSWPQRWILIVTGFLGWGVSRYLGAYQLGYIDTIWDPFFGDSSRRVLNSEISHSLPVSDAALGTLAYTFEFLMGWMGSPSRWRTMPWMVTFFGILVIPLGLVHIFLVISQPVTVGYWCTFCLLAAAIMLPMIPLEADEVIAMIQHVKKRRKKGDSFWKVFWKGGEPIEKNEDERTPALIELPSSPGKVLRSCVWGMSYPWNLTIAAIIGITLMALPDILSIEKPLSDLYHLGGAMVTVISVIAYGEIFRAGRYLNFLIGTLIAVLPWFLDGGEFVAQTAGSVPGLFVVILSYRKGPQKESYGSWDIFIR